MRLVLGVLLLLDVFPSCGGTKVVIREAGEDCGHRGPRWRGDCRAPLKCWTVETGGARCTLACDDDAACASLGPEFKCNTKGSPYLKSSEGAHAVCSKP